MVELFVFKRESFKPVILLLYMAALHCTGHMGSHIIECMSQSSKN